MILISIATDKAEPVTVKTMGDANGKSQYRYAEEALRAMAAEIRAGGAK